MFYFYAFFFLEITSLESTELDSRELLFCENESVSAEIYKEWWTLNGKSSNIFWLLLIINLRVASIFFSDLSQLCCFIYLSEISATSLCLRVYAELFLPHIISADLL